MQIKVRYSVSTYVLFVSCVALAVLLVAQQVMFRAQLKAYEIENGRLREAVEQSLKDERQLKLFTLQQMRTTLIDRQQLPLYSQTAGEMAAEISPYFPNDNYLWWVMRETKVLHDGLTVDEAKAILGEPAKFTEQPAYGKPPYYEWRNQGNKLTADLVDGKLTWWRPGHLGIP